jgi:two-component system response regulator AtoC
MLPELAVRFARFTIEVPPLRDYGRDLRLVIDRFCRSAEQRLGKRPVVLTQHALAVLQRQPWLGNARQLQDVVDPLVAFSCNGTITKSEVEVLLVERAGTVGSMRLETEKRRRSELVKHLEAADGNLAEVARRIGMSRGAVIYRAQKYGLLPDRKTRRSPEASGDGTV